MLCIHVTMMASPASKLTMRLAPEFSFTSELQGRYYINYVCYIYTHIYVNINICIKKYSSELISGLHRFPRVKLSPSKTIVGKPVSAIVAFFSSRGPSSIAPAILKVNWVVNLLINLWHRSTFGVAAVLAQVFICCLTA